MQPANPSPNPNPNPNPKVRELHEEGVRVLWPLMPWDTATRYELTLTLDPKP